MHKVLLAVDGSTASLDAARLLARFPHRDRLDVTVLSVVQRPFTHGSSLTGEMLEKAFEQDKAFASETYEKVAGMFEGANTNVRHEIRQGNVGPAIVEAAEEGNADLVVVAATGKSQISRVLLGSVSDHVATHTRCSVLVVRPTGLKDADHPIRVCLAYEGTGPAQAALEEISEIPWRLGSDFHLLSVASYMYDFFGEFHKDSDAVAGYLSDLRQAKEQLVDVAPDVQTHLIESEHLGEGIVTFAEKNEIDLLVVGETQRNVVNRFFMGSTSRYVLRHAPCSVWISRNRTIHGPQKTQQATNESQTT